MLVSIFMNVKIVKQFYTPNKVTAVCIVAMALFLVRLFRKVKIAVK